MVQQISHNRYIYARNSGTAAAAYYDYAPDMIYHDGVYHMYWCGGVLGSPVNGDYILHAQANTPEGPFHASNNGDANSYDIALRPTGQADSFDGAHTCDPTVIKVNDKFFLYYSGAALGANGMNTAIGVAFSSDGVNFQRLNDGKPIVTAANKSNTKYGAGQPTVLYYAPYFYLSFTDTTGSGAAANGAGQFLLRSPDPTFLTGVEELIGPTRWVSRAPGQHSAEFRFLEAFSIDWMYDAPTNKIVVASNQDSHQTFLYILNPDTFSTVDRLQLAGTWRDGPGIVKNANRTSLARGACTAMDISVVKGDSTDSDYGNTGSWDISLSKGLFNVSPYCGNGGAGSEGGENPGIPPVSASPEVETVNLAVEAVKLCSGSGSGTSNIPSTKVGEIEGWLGGLEAEGSSLYVTGWACIVGQTSPIDVEVHLGGPAGSAGSSFKIRAPTTVSSEYAIHAICGTSPGSTTHRYKIDVTSWGGADAGKSIYVHGINPRNKMNYFLRGSGRCVVGDIATMPRTSRSRPTAPDRAPNNPANMPVSANALPDGTLMISPGLPPALVTNGVRLQFESLEAVEALASRTKMVDSATYHSHVYGGSVHRGGKVYGSEALPAAFFTELNELWPVSCSAPLEKNGSSIQMIPAVQYHSYPIKGNLFCR